MARKPTSVLFSAVLSVMFVVGLSGQSPQGDQSAKMQRRMAIVDALRKPDGLHLAAKASGGSFYMSKSWYGFARVTTLESLAQNSDMAVIGTPLSREIKLVDEGRSIVTEYKVKVQEPIQGGAKVEDILIVDLPGGKVAFEDGTTAEVDVADFPRLEIDHRYVIYLALLNEPSTFEPLGGPEGVFELKDNGKISPFATPQYTEAAAENDDLIDFVGKVRAAAHLQKRP